METDWTDSFIGTYFGSDNGFYNVWLNGKIDQVATFDAALSAYDIQTYNGMYLSGSEPSLKGLWNFNEGQGTVLNDLSGNGNNGTIDGAVWDTDVPSLVQTTFQPQTKEELQAVDLWVDDNATALVNYGEINSWDVSLITDMSDLFYGKTTFNDDISSWDVSNVVNMANMFRWANVFNGDISSWDVSNV